MTNEQIKAKILSIEFKHWAECPSYEDTSYFVKYEKDSLYVGFNIHYNQYGRKYEFESFDDLEIQYSKENVDFSDADELDVINHINKELSKLVKVKDEPMDWREHGVLGYGY
jgi:hypothetical protein